MLFQVGHTSTSEWRTVSCFFFSLLVLTEIEVNMATRSCTSTRRALHSLLPFPFLITHQQSNIPNFLPVRHPGIQDSRARNASLSRLPLLHRCEPLLCTVAGSPPTRYVLPSSPLPPTTPAGPSRAPAIKNPWPRAAPSRRLWRCLLCSPASQRETESATWSMTSISDEWPIYQSCTTIVAVV